MHPVLQLPDLLREILGHLQQQQRWNATPDTLQERRHLISAALACRMFLNPALEILWKRMDSLTPLLKLLPGFRWAGDFYILTGNISCEELARFERYANCVRELEYRRDEYIHPSIFHRLLVTRSSPLLPQLRVLVWEDADPSTLEPFFLLSPSLERVDIKLAYAKTVMPKEDYALEAFIHALTDRVPYLQHFAFSGSLRCNYLSVLTKLRSLKSLKLSGRAPITVTNHAGETEVIAALATSQMYYEFSLFEHLTSLEIDVDGLQALYASLYYPFPALRHLQLSGNLHTIISTLDTVSTRMLTSLTIYFANNHPEDLHLLFLKIPHRFPRLRALKIHAAMPAWWQPVTPVSFAEAFGPLVALHSLQDVILELENVALAVNDQDTAMLARAWPSLVSFATNYSMVYDAPSPSLWCLIPFAYHCPRLESLSIPVRMAIPSAGTWQPPPHGHGLKMIDLLEWPGEYIDVVETAVVLDRLFPALDLETIASESWRSSTWKAVFQAMEQRRKSRWQHTSSGLMALVPMHSTTRGALAMTMTT